MYNLGKSEIITMQQKDRKKAILIVLITAMTLILSVVAIATAWRLRQVATVPVTPNVPQSIPQAAENPTPTPQLVCSVNFEVAKSSCDGWCDEDLDCESGMVCQITQGQMVGVCRNPSCVSDVDCICAGASPTPSPTGHISGTPSPTSLVTPTITPTVNPSVTPASSPTPTSDSGPSPTGQVTSPPQPTSPPGTLVACNGSCTNDENCSGSNVCQDGMCRNPSCSSETDCTCAAAVVPTAPALPQAGSDMPTIVLLSMGTLILLAGLIGLLVL